jgi:branched-chain amino acid transport system substrate-binding protein
MPQLRQQGFDQQILGADASDDSQCPTGGGEAFDGYLLTGFGGPDVLSGDAAARAEDFASLFDVVFPDAPDFNGFTLAGADAFNVLVQAVDDADSTDGDAVLEALQNLEGYPGVSGEITYAGTDGTPADRTIAFFEYAVPGEDGSEWSKASLFGVGTGE